MIDSPFLIRPGSSVKLSKLSTDASDATIDKDDAKKQTEKDKAKAYDLQEVLFAGKKRALLVVLQAMDAGGKDSTIRHVLGHLNPAGCRVWSFGVPSTEEARHDYLWRIHHRTPERGMVGVFNRSHYESVLVERVLKLTPKKTWKQRYAQLNAFERLLSGEGTAIIKIYLHLSQKEQAKRMLDRLERPDKYWKFNPSDLKTRALWDKYEDAFTDMLEKCSTSVAPWFAVPADDKWYRDYIVADILRRTMEAMNLEYPPTEPDVLENLEEYKKQLK